MYGQQVLDLQNQRDIFNCDLNLAFCVRRMNRKSHYVNWKFSKLSVSISILDVSFVIGKASKCIAGHREM